MISSFGKTYHCTGWKVGYCIAPPALSTEFRKVHQYNTFCSFTPAQYAFAAMIDAEPEHYEQLGAFYQAKRDHFRAQLLTTKLKPLPVPGGYFQLVDYSAVSDLDRPRVLPLADERTRGGGDSAVAVLRGTAPGPAPGAAVFREERGDAGCGDRAVAEALTGKSMQDLRISLVQGATRWHDPAGNRDYYARSMSPLKGATDLILLPETFTSGFSNEAIHNAETMDGPTVDWLRGQSRELDAAITGSVQLRTDDGVFNRLFFATPDGSLHHYDKRHLFRYAKEHERYAAGRDRLTVEWKGWRICPLVCYDLRFPVYSRNRFDFERQGGLDYDLLLYVANWPAARAQAWKALLPARAIENLSYVAGLNRVGVDGNGLHYSGDSAVFDFLGSTLVESATRKPWRPRYSVAKH